MPAFATEVKRRQNITPKHETPLMQMNKILKSNQISQQSEKQLAILIKKYISSKDTCANKITNLANAYYLLLQKNPNSAVLPKISNAIVGQIKYLSQKETHLSATQKINEILNINPITAQEPKILKAAKKALSQQYEYLKQREEKQAKKWLNISIANTFATDYEIFSPLGQSWTRWADADIRYYPKDMYVNGEPLVTTNYLRKEHRELAESGSGGKLRGKSVSLEDKDIPQNIGECALDYYEAIEKSARKMLEITKDSDIREYLWKKIANANKFTKEMRQMKKEGAGKKEIVYHLITSREDFEQSDLKINAEKYWNSLYDAAGDSDIKKGMIWYKRHGGTILLWMAYVGSILDPPAGAAMFTLLGSGQTVQGIQKRDLQQTLFGLSMIGGFSKNPFVSTASAAYMYTTIGTDIVELIHSVSVTDIGSADIESLSNNVILLHGWFRTRAEKIGMKTPRTQRMRTQKKETRPNQKTKTKPEIQKTNKQVEKSQVEASTENIVKRANSGDKFSVKFEIDFWKNAEPLINITEGNETMNTGKYARFTNKKTGQNRWVKIQKGKPEELDNKTQDILEDIWERNKKEPPKQQPKHIEKTFAQLVGESKVGKSDIEFANKIKDIYESSLNVKTTSQMYEIFKQLNMIIRSEPITLAKIKAVAENIGIEPERINMVVHKTQKLIPVCDRFSWAMKQQIMQKPYSVIDNTYIYLGRDGWAMMFAQMLKSSNPQDNITTITFTRNMMITRPTDISHIFDEIYTPQFLIEYRDIRESALKSDAAKNTQYLQKRTEFESNYDIMFENLMDIDVYRNEISKIYQYLKDEKVLKTDQTGRILPQNFIVADIGFISFPPFLKKVIEYGAVEFDGLKPGEVTGEILFYQTAKGFEYLPNVRKGAPQQKVEPSLLSVSKTEDALEIIDFSDPMGKAEDGTPIANVTSQRASDAIFFYLLMGRELNRTR